MAEAESGQFELNLKHSHRVVEVCDNVLALRRLTRYVAEKQGLQANFMAKPFSQQSGSGLHFHFSLNDIHGENVFASPVEALNSMMRLCIAGQLALMPASLAILAPGVNAFRRLRKTSRNRYLTHGAITPAPPRCVFPALMTITGVLSTGWPGLMQTRIWWRQRF